MAELDRSISEFQNTNTAPVGSLVLVSLEDQQATTGYSSFKMATEKLAQEFLSGDSFPLLLDTTSKNAIGAVNELAARPTFARLTGTLTAGQTSVTISDAAILDNSVIQIFTDPLIPVLSAVVPSGGGSITITFDEQLSNVGITLFVW